jgi:hypothetical protein
MLTPKKPIYIALQKLFALVERRSKHLDNRIGTDPAVLPNRRKFGKGGNDGIEDEPERIGSDHIIRLPRCNCVGDGLTTILREPHEGR